MSIYIDGYPVKIYLKKGKHASYRELKLLLIEKFGVCYWCGIKVKDYGNLLCKPPTDEATIDHVIPIPLRKKGEIVPKVLACYECNQRRSLEK